MSYILKTTTSPQRTKITDAGRKKISEGNFNISYFQIGDSEISYKITPNSTDFNGLMMLDSVFNAHNNSGAPNSNKQHVKYPYYVKGNSGNTYGIPFMDSTVDVISNTAAPRGFFTGNTDSTTISWSALTSNEYVINSNYVAKLSNLNGTNEILVEEMVCNGVPVREPQTGDFAVIYYDGLGDSNCGCSDVCKVSFNSCHPILTYRVVDFCDGLLTIDRDSPTFDSVSDECYGRILIYPSGMTEIYDSETPLEHWDENVINFESTCSADQLDVKIWNMNIVWSENVAGMSPTVYSDFSEFNSFKYIGTKEFLGYQSSLGQTDSDSVYFYNSFGDKIVVTPEQQKGIAIIHYTNNTIDYFYGERFGMDPHDPDNVFTTTGEGRNFKLHLPTLMWHKNPVCCYGQTFWVDPEGFEDYDLFQVEYLTSKKNADMNYPGIRYYHLWDNNPNINGLPNRIGKVFPDQEIIIIDDEEIIAAMSYKSNRNWTLPAPKLTLTTPNTCGSESETNEGLLSGNTEYLYVTYRLTNDVDFTNSLHCNYYMKIQGPNQNCGGPDSQNVGVKFGGEFPCLGQEYNEGCNLIQGFYGNKFEVICQKITGTDRPDPEEWKIIDFTNEITSSSVNGYITQSGITGTTFVITKDSYDLAPLYDLGDYVELSTSGNGNLNFGDEYFFYGELETDIQATIYEMKYKVNLGNADFQKTSNPSYVTGEPIYITEIGLYDSNKELMIISKLQSPQIRQGNQQFVIKFDF